jgi:hypothetical protein
MRPRRSSDASGRPLNLTVRRRSCNCMRLGWWLSAGAAGAKYSYSTGVNTTGARPISLISPIIRIAWCGTQRSIGGAPSSRLRVNLAKTLWLKSIRAHARMSRTSLGGLPDAGFFANARNSLASCGGRSGRRRTKYLLCRTAILVLYALALARQCAHCAQAMARSAPPNHPWRGP